MQMKKNLIKIKECPICKKKKFINYGRIINIHKDLKNLFDLMACKNCKHWFLSMMPKEKFLRKLYENKSHYVFGENHVCGFKKKLESNFGTYNHWIYRAMKNENKGNYLEVGPGGCELLNNFEKRGWRCEGFELSKWIKSKNVFHDIKKITKNNKDILVFNDVLEHTVDPIKILKRFSKFQKKGSKLFIAYPNSSSLKAKILKTRWPMVAPLAHLNFFSIDSSKILLKECGYHPITIKETSFVIFRKLIRNILRLPITITLDMLNFRMLKAIKRIEEVFLNIFDLIKGDQMNIIGIKK